ncbi:MAG: FkbM family methyltransferase [gamma proteobacterium symbiont of Lucinoma myriamae]|nr:FkbM family methyltransferase [gamma proteobacterium symbiont of Lucinoma myriamae]MCU7817598.1 FkbM family methyltransferase [gamma proteobacterium symbiont of Lucinoma myriamae]
MKFIKAIGKLILRKVLGEIDFIEYLFSSGRINKNSYYDKLTELVMKKVLKPSSVCIDVGCHKGSILRLMMKYAPNGTFLAFEPLPHLYEKLIQDFRSDNIHLYNLALSNTEGESSFNYVISNPAYSGLIKRRYDRPKETDTKIVVKTQQLDTILSNENIGRVSFIKIDVEGAEYLVIDGAQARIKSDKPIIVFEHGVGGSDYYGKRPEDVFELLSIKCGLQISLMSRWLKGEPSLDLEAFCDQFYNRKNYYFIAYK